MEEKEFQQKSRMLVQYFNLVTGMHYRFESKRSLDVTKTLLEVADVHDIRVAMKEWANKNPTVRSEDAFQQFSVDFVGTRQKAPEAPAPAPAPVANANLDASINFLGQVVTDLLAKTKMSEVEAEVGNRLEEHVKKFIFDNYGPLHRKIEIQLGERKTELEGVVHEKFDEVLKFVQADEPVFLTGPAGSGKNVLCQQVAKTLGLDFYFSNAVTQEYKITGFTDANGTFHESQFYKAFKNGGVFMLDEMDASIPEVLIILNAAIANRYFDFPAPIGYVEANPNFRVIAAGNTFGAGADYDYVGRNQLDAASLDRFALVRVDYDAHIEENCANGDADLLQFCRKFRESTKKAGIRTVVSYRAISRMAKLSACLSPAELLDTCLVKSLDVDDLNAIKDDLSGCGKYSAGFKTILSSRQQEVK